MSHKTSSHQTSIALLVVALLSSSGCVTPHKYMLRMPTVPITIVIDQQTGMIQPVPWRAYASPGQTVEWFVPVGELAINWKQGHNPSRLTIPGCQKSTYVPGWTCSLRIPAGTPYDTNRYTVRVTIGKQVLEVDPEVVIEG
jgi:hypothetical protein